MGGLLLPTAYFLLPTLKEGALVFSPEKKSWMLIAKYAGEGMAWKMMSVILLVIVVFLALALAKSSQTPRRAYIVPGARPGIYAPGDAIEDVVVGIAENFVLLIASVTSDTADIVAKRSSRYLSAVYRSRFLEDQKMVIDSLRAGDISFLFSPESHDIRKVDEKTYVVTIKGMRSVLAAGEVKKKERYYYEVFLERTTPDDLNIYGFQITEMRKGRLSEA